MLKIFFQGLQIFHRKLLNKSPYERIMNLQNNMIDNLENLCHLGVIPIPPFIVDLSSMSVNYLWFMHAPFWLQFALIIFILVL
jgi:hypothetical protein